MKRIIFMMLMAVAIALPSRAFLVEEEDGHFVVCVPDNLNQKSVDSDGWTRYTNSFGNQHVAYILFHGMSGADPKEVLMKFSDRYLSQQSAPARGRLCGESSEGFSVILYNPDDPSTWMVIAYTYDIPYQSALRKFNEFVSCSRYVR